MRSILFSGGGAHGVFGLAKAEELPNTYEKIYGWSVGSLIALMYAVNRLNILKQIFFTINNSSVFNIYPFDKNGKFKIGNAILRTILQKPTFGETIALKELIDKYFTIDLWNILQSSGKEVIIGTSNLKYYDLRVEYFSSKEVNFETFKMAMWASASPLFYGSIVALNSGQYTDAGTVEILNFKKALDSGATYIDAIIHRTKDEDNSTYSGKIKTTVDYAGRMLPSLLNDCPSQTIALGAEWARSKGVQVNEYYMPYQPDYGPFQFDNIKMKAFYYNCKK